MALAKTTFLCGFAVAVTGVASAQTAATWAICPGGSKGGELLFRAFEKSKRVPIEAIVLRADPMDPGQFTKMRLQQAPNGWMRMTVLAPLSSQGVTMMDNGKEWQTYLPDESRLLIQDSPRLSASNNTSRRPRAELNYRFRVSEGETIAGRPTLTITATPRAPQMPTREYSLDRETEFILRMTTVSDNVDKMILDTQYANFSARVDTADWNIDPLKPTRTIRMMSPKPIRSASEAKQVVGFMPALPNELPLGFAILEQHLAGKSNHQFVAVRITDGLVSATVYQWNGNKLPDLNFGGPTRAVEAKGVKLQAVGDLPEVVLARITDAFLRELLKGLTPLLGTLYAPEAFATSQQEYAAGKATIFLAPRPPQK